MAECGSCGREVENVDKGCEIHGLAMVFTPEPVAQAIAQTKLDASFMKDADRWIDSYINHSATALHNRATAAGNGFGIPVPKLCKI